MSRVGRVAASVLLTTALAAACGVPTQKEAAAIDPERVPADLLPETRGPDPTSPAEVEVTVFFVSEDRLAAASRRVADPGPGAVLRALLDGPTARETDQGLRSALPDADMVLEARRDGSAALVDLPSEFTDTDPAEQRVALAQLVFSLTANTGVDAVVFTLEGEPTNVPRADGTTTAGPVRRSDYDEMSPTAG